MPAYQYVALESGGQERKGVIEADTARTARTLLRGQGLTPLSVTQLMQRGKAAVAQSLWSRSIWGGARKVFDRTALAVWTRQLAGLTGAGLPLERALTALIGQSDNERIAALVAALRAEVNAGAALAVAMSHASQEFDATYCAVIAAGEQGGHLGAVLDALANELEAQQGLRNKVVGAALYPLIVCVIAALMVFFLMTYVVPQVAQVFVGSHRSLPLLTTLMLALSEHARHWWWLWMLLWGGAFVALRAALKREAFRVAFDARLLRLPLWGRIARGYNTARFAGTLAMLAGAGVPILKSLQTATQTLSNRAMQQEAERATVEVREGTTLGAALDQCQSFPRLLSIFARMGEQTGQLPAMLLRASTQLSGEVQRRTLALTTLLEPLLIVVMGVIVLLIVLSVLLPIIQMNQLMQ